MLHSGQVSQAEIERGLYERARAFLPFLQLPSVSRRLRPAARAGQSASGFLLCTRAVAQGNEGKGERERGNRPGAEGTLARR